ncbi:hypothetical protein [Sphingomonas bacterium]|uniref:hypothetical protein n=1 Tax=Sphingomonas bacterium TaxID=1895847 RepID=UPI00157554B9|nr:hypothetical protein [Sphingomonas bacterium]
MSRLFRSRWAALLWAAGICWTAYDVAASQPATPANAAAPVDATGEPVEGAALAVLANAAP